jgi:hypothetical protein
MLLLLALFVCGPVLAQGRNPITLTVVRSLGRYQTEAGAPARTGVQTNYVEARFSGRHVLMIGSGSPNVSVIEPGQYQASVSGKDAVTITRTQTTKDAVNGGKATTFQETYFVVFEDDPRP